MNGAKRPSNRAAYRQRIYRRRKIKYIVLISSAAVAALIVIFLIVGNILDRKVSTVISSIDDLDNAPSVSTDTGDVHEKPQSFKAHHTALSQEGSSLDSRLAALSTNGTTAVCFELDSKDGDVFYSSPVAQKLGYQESGSGLWKLGDAADVFEKRGIYSIGITYLSELDNDDDLMRSAAIGYYSARIVEAIRYGIDEILIYAPHVPAERLGEITSIADEVHRLAPEANIGISLPYPLPENNTDAKTDSAHTFSDALVEELWNAFDFFAVDVCYNANGDATTAEEAESRIGELLYYVLRYNMRILIPSGDESLTDGISELCEERNLENMQFMP